MKIGNSPNHTSIQTTLRHLGASLDQVNSRSQRLSSGQQINPAQDDPAGLISSEQLSRVLTLLEAEAFTLRRADEVTRTADGYLATASDLLSENAALEVRLANTAGLSSPEAKALQSQVTTNQQAVAHVTSAAAFNGVPLFDGEFSINVGGGSLSLPDLVSSVPTQAALATLRGQIGAYQKHVIGSRLNVVETTIENTLQARSLIRDTDYAAETAALLRDQTLASAGISATQRNLNTMGAIIDLLA